MRHVPLLTSVVALLALPATAFAQWTAQPVPTTADLRGLSVVSDRVAWASGTHGTVLRTTDGGAHWDVIAVRGADSLDFRDVEAFDARTAVALASGTGASARVYRTTDGGHHWALTLTNPDSAGFLDAIAFWDAKHGLAFGDPVDGRFVVYRTGDGGARWDRVRTVGGLPALPPALPNEGAFAASGTCLVVSGDRDAWFATGGATQARVFHSADRGATWQAAATPVVAGSAGAGIFSLVFADARHGVAVGGDYTRPSASTANVALTDDGGATWTLAPGPLPAGYLSGAAASGNGALVAVGTSGTSRSDDGGRRWSEVDASDLNAVRFAPDGRAGWAVGPGGRVMRWSPAATR